MCLQIQRKNGQTLRIEFDGSNLEPASIHLNRIHNLQMSFTSQPSRLRTVFADQQWKESTDRWWWYQQKTHIHSSTVILNEMLDVAVFIHSHSYTANIHQV